MRSTFNGGDVALRFFARVKQATEVTTPEGQVALEQACLAVVRGRKREKSRRRRQRQRLADSVRTRLSHGITETAPAVRLMRCLLGLSRDLLTLSCCVGDRRRSTNPRESP